MNYLRKCKKCGLMAVEQSELELFAKASIKSRLKYNKQTYCKKCYAENMKEYRGKHKTKNQDYHLRSIYGITLEDYYDLLDLQNGKCAICGSSDSKNRHSKWGRFYVDHCHSSGKIRGLLCNTCNRALGMFGDNVVTLKSAVEYLEKGYKGKK